MLDVFLRWLNLFNEGLFILRSVLFLKRSNFLRRKVHRVLCNKLGADKVQNKFKLKEQEDQDKHVFWNWRWAPFIFLPWFRYKKYTFKYIKIFICMQFISKKYASIFRIKLLLHFDFLEAKLNSCQTIKIWMFMKFCENCKTRHN